MQKLIFCLQITTYEMKQWTPQKFCTTSYKEIIFMKIHGRQVKCMLPDQHSPVDT